MKEDRNHTITLPNPFVEAVLFSLFSLGYIAGPYWMIPQAVSHQILLLTLTTGLSLFWATRSSAELTLPLPTSGYKPFLVVAVILLALNFRALTIDMPMRGDEDYHISAVLNFAHKIKSTISFHLPFLLLMILFWCAAFRKSKYYPVFGAGVLLYLVMFGISGQIYQSEILRYPFFSRLFQVIPPLAASGYGGLYNEAAYRIVPFVSVIFLVWLVMRNRPFDGFFPNLLTGIAVGSMPVVCYYATILYLEMPAVLLMTAVCFSVERLFHDNCQQVKQHPAWYALIMIGFIKETSLIFLILFLFFRGIAQVRKKRDGESVRWREEVSLIFCTLLPAMIYLLYRFYFGTTRNTSFEIANIMQVHVYFVLVRSFLDQFGFYCILFAAGCFLLIRNRKFLPLAFSLSAIAVSSLFYIAENTKWTGYSRFNLFVLPFLFFVSAEFQHSLKSKKKVAVSVLLITIAVNIMLYPIHMDGSRKPMWGNYLVDTSEHYYPYRAALRWFRESHPSRKLLFSGMNYPYFFSFYFRKYDWSPQTAMLKSDYHEQEDTSLAKALETARLMDFDMVLFQYRDNRGLQTDGNHGYRLIKVFRNQAHSLGIYARGNDADS